LIKIKGKGPIRVFLWAAFNKSGDWPMSETISRRESFSLQGLAAALGFAAPTVLTSSNAEAQTEGMERRQDRRANRQQNRQDRRTDRQDRRNGGKSGDTAGGKSGDKDD
jgi:hypothetical protein